MSSLEDRRHSPRRRTPERQPHYYYEVLGVFLVVLTMLFSIGVLGWAIWEVTR